MRTKQLILFISLLFISGCFKESEVIAPATGVVTLQLHDYNAEGFDPDILYFKQKDDGSYTFTLSGKDISGYVLRKMDAKGFIDHSFQSNQFPSDGDIRGTFDQLYSAGNHPDGHLEIPHLYSIKDNVLSYSVKRPALDKIVTFNLDVETGTTINNPFVCDQSPSPVTGKAAGIFQTSDGGYMTVTEKYNNGTNPPIHYLTYSKFTSGGSSEFALNDTITDSRIYTDFLTDTNGEYYFVQVNPGDNEYTIKYNNQETAKLESYITLSDDNYEYKEGQINDQGELLNAHLVGTFPGWFSTVYADSTLDVNGTPDFEVEIRFGPGIHQQAYRYIYTNFPINRYFKVWENYLYKDYVEVPFQVWNITNNRQLMVGFNDQGWDGGFNLIHERFCYAESGEDVCYPATCVCLYDIDLHTLLFDFGPTSEASMELVMISDLPYSITPDPELATNGGMENSVAYSFLPVLSSGATWSPSELPTSSLVIKKPRGIQPGSKLVKIKQEGISTEDDFLTTIDNTVIKNIYKTVPYNGGYAILCNVSGLYAPDEIQPSLLFFVDADFNQIGDAVQLNTAATVAEKLERHNTTNAILYSCLEEKKLKLIAFKNGNPNKFEKLLSDFSQFQVEGYTCTPTNTGGWAVLAWVRPTASTRDLLFLEFDENLNLVKK